MSSHGRRPHGAARASAAVLVGAGVLLAASLPARAQTIGPRDEDVRDDVAAAAVSVRLGVTAFTGVLGPGSVLADPDPDPSDLPSPPEDLELRLVIGNDGEQELDALRLVVEVHPPARSRSELHAALDHGPVTQPAHVHDQPVGPDGVLGPGEVVVIEEHFTGDEVDWAPDLGGVHPVTIAVLRGTVVLAEARTAVVWLGALPTDPLHFSLLYPIDGAPWRTVGGAYPGTVDRAVEPGGRLDRLVAALERHPDAPVILAPAAHLLEDLADRSDGFTTLRRSEEGALESRSLAPDSGGAQRSLEMLYRLREVAAALPMEPVASSYANADLSALAAGPAPLPGLAAEAAADGRRRLQRSLGRTVDASTHLLGGHITPATLDLLPGEVVLVPYRVTSAPPLEAHPDVGSPVRTLRTPAGRLMTGIVTDPYLDASLSSPDLSAGPLLAGHRPLAESAMVYFEAPSRSDRALVTLPDPTWSAEPRLLDALLAGVAGATWLEPSSPSELALHARRNPDPIGLLDPVDGNVPAGFASALATATRDLDAARAALPETTATIAGRSYAELRDQLLRAASRWWRPGQVAEAEALLRDVQRAADEAFGDVEVARASVTLTSDVGQVPITLQRTRGGPIVVQVEVASQGRLLFPDGHRSEPLLLEEGTSQTVTFPTEALSTGTFPVTVRVTDPDGGRELARTTLSVRSTAISGPALTVTGTVILLLLLAGSLRRRPSEARRLALVTPGAGTEQPPPAAPDDPQDGHGA